MKGTDEAVMERQPDKAVPRSSWPLPPPLSPPSLSLPALDSADIIDFSSAAHHTCGAFRFTMRNAVNEMFRIRRPDVSQHFFAKLSACFGLCASRSQSESDATAGGTKLTRATQHELSNSHGNHTEHVTNKLEELHSKLHS
jgi:hypothetical protein